MYWLIFLPLTVFTLAAIGNLAVTLLVERAERQRKRRYPARLHRIFRPKIIPGGKLPAPPDAEEPPSESKSA
jgi:hypothetical protein